MVHAIVIFGCAVRADGRPSASLARRIGYGVSAALDHPEALVICSGAAGAAGPSEAAVMARELIAQGVDSARLVLDEKSRDTLQSAVFAAHFLRSEGLADCLACSDGYHLPRIRLTLAALGVRARAGPRRRGPAGSPMAVWLFMHLREAVALPYDLAIILTHRRGLLAAPL